VTPYVFGPGNQASLDTHEHGVGTYGGFQLRRSVVGVSVRTAWSTIATANTYGAYARVGFGAWGIMAEHDFSNEHIKTSALDTFERNATYAQVFVAPREWLVTSLVGERLVAEYPASTHVYRLSPDIQVRLTSSFTLRFWTHDSFVGPSNHFSRTYSLQLAAKTVR
jgi:hypothetical protein